MIIALAGRRVDPPGAEPRFPLQNVARVERDLAALFRERNATMLISSAAAGSDLLAQSAAGALGIARRVVLPADRETFRTSSVTDRPGDWGAMYDRVLDEVTSANILVLPPARDADTAYANVNQHILDEAQRFARERAEPVCAVAVWDGKSRGEGDLTEAFTAEARTRGIPVIEVFSGASRT